MNGWRQCDNKFINAHIRMLFIASMMVCLAFIRLDSAVEAHRNDDDELHFPFNVNNLHARIYLSQFLFYLFILRLSFVNIFKVNTTAVCKYLHIISTINI